MNLYDLMGPMAVAGGIGAFCGVEQSHDPAFWASTGVGAVVGFGTFLVLRKATSRVIQGAKAPVSERLLLMSYIGTPICVLVATFVGAWVVRATV